MAYKTVSLATAKVMVKSFKDLADEIKELDKDKKNKAKVKTLEKDLEAKGKKIDEVLVKIIGDTRKEFLQHAAKIEGLLGETVTAVKALQAGVKAFKAKPSNDLLLKLTPTPNELAKKVAAARADNTDFGSSWFELRGIKWTSEGLAEKYNKKFYEQRFELMGDAKSVVSKIEQMDNLQQQAVLLANEMRMLYTSGEQDKAAIEEDAEELLAKVKKIHKDMDDKTYESGRLDRMKAAIAQAPDAPTKEALLSTVRSRTQDAIGVNKEVKLKEKTLTKEVEQLKKIAKDPTDKAKAALEECETLLAKFKEFAQRAADEAKANAELFKQTMDELKALAKKK